MTESQQKLLEAIQEQANRPEELELLSIMGKEDYLESHRAHLKTLAPSDIKLETIILYWEIVITLILNKQKRCQQEH